jgi:outer membrane protein assembly factor BamB
LVCLDLETGKVNWSFHSSFSGANNCLTCSSPGAADDRVFFGGLDGFAYALDARAGKLLWKRDLGAKVTTSAAIKGRDLYLGTANRQLYRLNTESGDVLSEMEAKATPYGRLVLSGDSLFAFIGDELLGSFDLNLTKLRWSAEASKEWTSARPYLWRGLVLAGNRHELVAVRSSDGARQWSHQFPETVRGIGTSADILYVGTLKGPIFAFSPKPD